MLKTAVMLQTIGLVVGWGSRSGKCVSSESQCLDGAVRGRSLVGAFLRVRVREPGYVLRARAQLITGAGWVGQNRPVSANEGAAAVFRKNAISGPANFCLSIFLLFLSLHRKLKHPGAEIRLDVRVLRDADDCRVEIIRAD